MFSLDRHGERGSPGGKAGDVRVTAAQSGIQFLFVFRPDLAAETHLGLRRLYTWISDSTGVQKT